MDQDERLAELRERHPDRPAYIHRTLGVPVVGPTAEELREVAEVLDQEGEDEAKALLDKTQALAFVRECNGEPELARHLSLGKRIKSVEEIVTATASVRFRGSTCALVARIRTKDGKRLLVHAWQSHFSGSWEEPPDSDAGVDKITEDQAAKLRDAWKR